MKTLQLEKTPPTFQKTARLAKKEVVVFTEKGKPTFALVAVKDDLALEALALGQNVDFMAYLEVLSQRARSGKTYSIEEMRKEFGSSSSARKRKVKNARND
ncbi:MAG: hypothetical protein HY717_13265 [Planctomycetes bacterium]|nr:hypothetical protein [Planctomycetota bacterium]